MAKKLFNKNLPHLCEYCLHGKVSEYGDEVFCKKRGVTERRDACRKYRYDALKRIPGKLKVADNYKAEDFTL